MKRFLLLLLLACAPALAQFQVFQPAPTATLMPPVINMPPGKLYVDWSTAPKPRWGASNIRLRLVCGPLGSSDPTVQCAGGSYTQHRVEDRPSGDFRISCQQSHWAADDPIVWPLQSGRTHGHEFFGGTSTGAFTTNPLLGTATTCSGGTLNKTTYWAPFPIFVCPVGEVGCINHGLPGSRDGQIFPAYGNIVYYKAQVGGAAALTQTVWWPVGFRMISGDPNNTTLAGMAKDVRFDCFPSIAANTGEGHGWDHIPSTAEAWTSAINPAGPAPCQDLNTLISFPQCSIADVSILYQPTPFGERASGHTKDAVYNSGCTDPAYPHLHPDLAYNIHRWVPAIADYDYLMLSSDQAPHTGVTRSGSTTTSIVIAADEYATTDIYKYGYIAIAGQRRQITAYNGTTKTVSFATPLTGSAPAAGTSYLVRLPGGRSMHADWWNGWDQTNNVLDWGRTITDQIIRGCYYNIGAWGNPANPASFAHDKVNDCFVNGTGDTSANTAEPAVGAKYYRMF